MAKKSKIVLKYFSATQAGEWWTVPLGHTLEHAGMAKWVVSGWDRRANIVYCACEGRTACLTPEKLDMRFMPEDQRHG